ncbi:MAG: cobalt ECF transporter T component CbiQ [Deltaproteobacteria bacterium]|nr:cobalt ECF transporter T component CbiQ [Deltaproteobacteria bacterium]
MHPEIDRFAYLSSPLHRLDPRAKIAVFAAFLVATALVRGLPGALLALALAVLWVGVSRIPLGFVLRRLKAVVLFLSAFLVLLPLTHPAGWQAGLLRGAVIFIKGLAMVLTVFPMFGTTPFHTSMKALSRLHVPERLVAMILFTYRYLFGFAEEVRTVQQAARARGFKPGNNRRTLATLGNLIGLTLVRAYERTERIYQAMLARGFKHKFGTLHEFSFTWPDAWKSLGILLAAVALVGVDRLWPKFFG